MVQKKYDREALKKHEKVGGYTISKYEGSGASAIAYKAYKDEIPYILKEYYPSGMDIRRNGNVLNVPAEKKDEYNKRKIKYEKAFRIACDIYKARNTSTSMSKPAVFFEENNTCYAVYTFEDGVSYDKRDADASLNEILKIGYRVAEIVARYHNLGYLCLDIKAENIFISSEIEENGRIDVLMFDFDSFIDKKDLHNGMIDTISIDCSKKFRPSELSFGALIPIDDRTDTFRIVTDPKQIDERTDMFLIADMIHLRIFGEQYNPAASAITFKYAACKYLSRYESDIQQEIKDELEDFFKKAFNRDKTKRHPDMNTFMKKLNSIIDFLTLCEKAVSSNGMIVYVKIKENKLYRYSQKMRKIFLSNTKFCSLQELRILENRLFVKSEDKIISPKNACTENLRLLLVGDGGMGKTTSLFEYWGDKSHKRICFLVELNKYSYETVLPDSDGFSSFILSYLVKSFNNDKYTDYKEILRKEQYIDQIRCLDEIFTETTAQYSIMLDGLNEMDNYGRERFIQELNHYSQKWKNVQFIVTSRKAYEGILDDFVTYSFIGLSDKTKEVFLSKKYTVEEIELIKQNTQLWNILDVPLFINIFSGEKMSVGCQSRGEILDYFFTSHKNSELYSEGTIQKHMPNSDEAEVRKFLIEYMLPFAANYMDIEKLHTIRTINCIDAFNKCYDLYTENDTHIVINEKAFRNYRALIASEKEGFAANKLYKLLTDNLCYFAYTANGKEYLEFSHQYFRDYFAAKHILNILSYAQYINVNYSFNSSEIIKLITKYGLNYRWSDDVTLLIGDMTQEYKKA